MRSRAENGLLLAVGAVLALSACAASRPSVADWQPGWDLLVGGIPTPAELGTPPDASLCQGALGLVRSAEDDLYPTPDRAIDEAVRNWVATAEDAFFECPPSSAAIPNMDFAYGQLERLEAEIAAVLELDRPG
jgi:hypothetical protein